MECLANIANDINELEFHHILFGNDVNTVLTVTHPLKNYLMNFACDLGVVFVVDKIDPELSRSTFRVDLIGAASCIDHFAVYRLLDDNIMALSSQTRCPDSNISYISET